jgi:osmotically inducible protein OsmC
LQLTSSHIVLKANIPGISQEKFEECTKNAKAGCPISKVLNLDISLDASLI